MKTHYSERGRFRFWDGTISLIEEAAQEVYALSLRHNWHSQISIPYNGRQFKDWEGNLGHDRLHVEVRARSRRRNATQPKEKVAYADLVEPGYQGMESVIDENILTLPEVSFSQWLIQDIVVRGKLTDRVQAIIQASHWQVLASSMCEEAKSSHDGYVKALSEKEIRDREWLEEHKDYYERLMGVLRDFSGKKDMERLIETLNSGPHR